MALLSPKMDTSKKEYLFADHEPEVRARLQVDDVALYSVTPSWMTRQIRAVLLEKVGPDARITDGTACVGGDTMAFAAVFAHVTAVESHPGRAAMLVENIAAAGLAGKVTVLQADFVNVGGCWEQDVVYLDAPWGGPEYRHAAAVDLFLEHNGTQVPLSEVCARVWPRTRIIALKVPVNFNGANFVQFFKAKTKEGDNLLVQRVDMKKALLVIISRKQ
jgi:hypothetical protein